MTHTLNFQLLINEELTSQDLNLETAIQDDKVMQDFDPESFAIGAKHSQKVKAPSANDYGSKDCVNLSSSTTVFSLKDFPQLTSPAIKSLANSKTCGLAMLVEKLIIQDKINAATKHLIRTLINRFHHHSVLIAVCSGDNTQNYVLQTVKEAAKFLHDEADHCQNALKSAAKLLIQAVKAFEINQIDFYHLEYNWKEFIFHFYRFRLNARIQESNLYTSI